MDGDDLCDEMDSQQWETMRTMGYSEEEITRAKEHKRWKEEVWLCKYMLKNRVWESDISCSYTDCTLRLALALDGLNRRDEAIKSLQNARLLWADNFRITLALAKLLFRDDKKDASFTLCKEIFAAYATNGFRSSPSILLDDVADAYYLGGWIKIHDDDHTNAYRVWKEGHLAIPTCPILSRQYGKRECWDGVWSVDELAQSCKLTCGSSIPCNSVFNLESDLDSFRCCELLPQPPPALSIFAPSQRDRGVVFRSRHPLLTSTECERVVDVVNEFHINERNGEWGTVRSSSVKTTDVAVEDVSSLRPWLRSLLHTRLQPLMSAAFPLLADGSQLTPDRLRVHDAFIVRYDAEKDMSLSLPEHCDTSAVSVVLSLTSEEEGHYTGGGTWFEALGPRGKVVNAEIGKAVVFAGPLKHAGYPISRGTRVILVLFMYVENYHYGPFLQRSIQQARDVEMQHDIAVQRGNIRQEVDSVLEDDSSNSYGEEGVLSSGGKKGGYVVYRQTVELVNMLQKSDVTTD